MSDIIKELKEAIRNLNPELSHAQAHHMAELFVTISPEGREILKRILERLQGKQIGESEIKTFVQDFIDNHNTDGQTFRKSDVESEGYWYTSKDGHASINVGLFFEYLLEEFIEKHFPEQKLKESEPEDMGIIY